MSALVVLGLTFWALERIARFHRVYVRGAAEYRPEAPMEDEG